MNLSFKYIFVLCVSSVMLLTGCQSGFVKKPDFGRLAFWKNENLRLASRKKDNILPPSRHFSPDGGEGSVAKEEMKEKIDQIIADGKKSKAQAIASNQDPIRKPYTLDSIDPKIGESKSGSNDFVLSEKINKLQSATNQALNASEDVVRNTGAAIDNAANAFTGLKNNLQSSTAKQIKNVANEFQNQSYNAIAKTNESVNQFVKNSENTFNKTVSNVRNSLDNSFPSGDVVANPFTAEAKSNSAAAKMNKSDEADFVSKYKQAAKQFGASKSDASQPGSNIQQSSFDSEMKPKSSATLQPASPVGATNYPSTSYGKFQPLVPSNKKDDKEIFKIPPQLLRGSGSFSPGSTKPLRPVNSGN